MSWHNLYLCCDDQHGAAEHLRRVLKDAGYTAYDPFDGLPGAVYQDAKRLFVTPVREGWVRVLGNVDDSLAEPLSTLGLCFSAALIDESAIFTAWQSGLVVDVETALATHLNAAHTADDLHQALTQPPTVDPTTADGALAVSVDLLPPDVQEMAQGLKTRQVNRLFNKVMKRINKQVGGDGESAQKLLRGDGPDWQTAAGQQIYAVMACLTLAAFWREPDFLTLRDAYQNHRRRQRNPGAMLYPGDAEAMQAVPDALDYMPVYGGRTE